MSPSRPSFLVFSDDWGEHPSSCQHLFKHLVRDHQVVWVNTIGMRTMKLNMGDLKKALRKVKKMFFGAHRRPEQKGTVPANLTVVQPLMLPFVTSRLVRKINAWNVVRCVRKTLFRKGIASPILVTTVPNACDYVGHFNETQKVYYCVDDFTQWPGLEHDLVCQMEKKLVEECDIFVATSTKLYERLNQTGKPTTLLTHGVDVEHFSKLPKKEHPLLTHIPKPRVGYFGLFDERSDQQLLAEVATRLPNVSFVITGRVETDVSKLSGISNIYFTGPVLYEELPAILSGWSICMLPYVINSLTSAINPLKLKEYIATNKPVITTALPEAIGLGKFLKVLPTYSDWCSLIPTLISSFLSDDDKKIRMKMLLRETWGEKSLLFKSFIIE